MTSILDLMREAFRKSDAFAELSAALEAGKSPLCASGLCQGARTMSAALLAEGKRALLVTYSDQRAQETAQDLRELGLKAAHFPAREHSFYQVTAESRELVHRRLTVLGDCLMGKTDVVCAPVEALQQATLSRQDFEACRVQLRPGDVFPPEELTQRLVRGGYRREEIVEGKGQFALRGGILDVYPVQSLTAYRVEFFDDEVDTIREMDVLTQRSVGNVQELCVYPATEAAVEAEALEKAGFCMQKELNARQRGEKKAQSSMPWLEKEDLEEDEKQAPGAVLPGQRLERTLRLLLEGQAAEDMEGFLPLFYEKRQRIENYLEPELILIEEPGRVRERAKEAHEGYLRELEAAVERGDGLKAQQGGMAAPEELEEDWKGRSRVLLCDLETGLQGLRLRGLFRFSTLQAPDLHGQQRLLTEELTSLKTLGGDVFLFSGGRSRGERLLSSLREKGFDVRFPEDGKTHMRMLESGFSRGFQLKDAGLYVLGDADLFGSSKQKAAPRRRKAGQKLAAFTDLKPGDYVVHENHGVGVYTGTVRLTIQGHSRDYLHIQYQGTDALYVPTDQLDRVQKYIGVKDAPPRLNKLGGAEWDRAKQRVRASLEDMAKELIQLYAQRQAVKGFAFDKDTPWQREFEDAFPYEETPDQLQCVREIKQDMEKPVVMDRLLCGDVGYGKTEVAMRAAFKAVMDGKQVAVLVPTTILAQQHLESMRRRLAGFPVRVEMLSRFRTPQEQKVILEKTEKGDIDILIGTHRLLGRDLRFKDLGLLVVDEEQRFGVRHKEKLKQLKQSVDVLTLSATPIPRTLHMSMVGIRDMSLLETPPEERYPVQTYVLEYSDALLRDAIQRELARKGQVYILYNRVRSIERFFAHVQQLVPEARVAVGHGQMKESMLEDVMLDFYEGRTDVLVCSTIIESGLDVQNANTMIVIDADRFGLSQLYQLRGRVGRSNRLAYCYLTVRPDKVITEQAEKRLRAIREFTEFGSGFKIAMRDLEIRGAGNLLGAQQHGHMSEVGYDLYLKIMEQTVRELKGEQTENESVETKVELQLDAYLPMEFVQGDLQRMDVYKRIAAIETRQDWEETLEELIDRFGDVPPEAENLLWISFLKAQAQKLGVDLVFLRAGLLTMRFSPSSSVDPNKLLKGLNALGGQITLSNTQPPCMVLRGGGEPEAQAERACAALETMLRVMAEREPS